jgi:2'-5' RNA ligase
VVSPDEVVRHLRHATAAWREVAADAPGRRPTLRWTDPGQWHVTVAFYGDVPDGAAPDLAAALSSRLAGLRAPELRLRGAGSYSGRTLWAGVTGEGPDDVESLAAILAAAGAAGADLGAEQDHRERRRAHLTLARIAGGARRDDQAPAELAAAVRALAVYVGPLWCPPAVVLFRSELGAGRAGGPLHDAVAEVALVG